MSNTVTFEVSLDVDYSGQGLDAVEPADSAAFTGTPEAVENAIREWVTKNIIVMDDERFDGPGNLVSTIIRIEKYEGDEELTPVAV